MHCNYGQLCNIPITDYQWVMPDSSTGCPGYITENQAMSTTPVHIKFHATLVKSV